MSIVCPLITTACCNSSLRLPDFNDAPTPPRPACLDHILWTWMRLADDDLSEERERRRS